MAEQTQGNVVFTPLNDKEKNSKLSQFARLNIKLKMWQKGSRNTIDLKINGHNPNQIALKPCSADDEIRQRLQQLLNKKMLFNVEYRGLKFFGTGILGSKGTHFLLNVPDVLYKSERRRDFRLLAYPTHNIKVLMSTNTEESDEDGNILDFSPHRHGDQTKLFTNFLKLVDGEPVIDEVTDSDDNIVAFRALDVSVSGIALRVSEFEKDLFKSKEKIPGFILVIDEARFHIPSAEVVYCIDYVDSTRKGMKHFKVGLRFLEVSEILAQKLTKELTQKMHKSLMEKEFEDFLK
ncbi:MAG: hypothetical protein ACOCUT_02925 [bacterium]